MQLRARATAAAAAARPRPRPAGLPRPACRRPWPAPLSLRPPLAVSAAASSARLRSDRRLPPGLCAGHRPSPRPSSAPLRPPPALCASRRPGNPLLGSAPLPFSAQPGSSGVSRKFRPPEAPVAAGSSGPRKFRARSGLVPGLPESLHGSGHGREFQSSGSSGQVPGKVRALQQVCTG
jgi:hypothetical protein